MRRWHNYRALPSADRRTAALAGCLNIVLNPTLRTLGAKRTYRLVTWLGQHSGKPHHGVADAKHVAGLVNHVSSVFPARSACLVRSLTLRALLLRAGVASELQLGTQRATDGVRAHAWLEVNGQAINDSPQIGEQYLAFTLTSHHW